MKEIEITIEKDGSSKIDLKGFEGKGCSEITDKLVEALGGEVVERTTKSDYYKTKTKPKVKQQQRF